MSDRAVERVSGESGTSSYSQVNEKVTTMEVMPNHRKSLHAVRRHSRWYEECLMSTFVQLVVGLLVVLLLPAMLLWGSNAVMHPNTTQVNTLWAVGVAFVVSVLLLKRLASFAGVTPLANVAPIVAGTFLLVFAIVLFGRFEFSRGGLLFGLALSAGWCFLGCLVGRRYSRLKVAVLPMKGCSHLENSERYTVRHLTQPDLEGMRVDGIVADLRSDEMTPEWERFIAECVLARIPVFNVRQVAEGMSGQVTISHLSENAVGALQPSRLYGFFKRLIDIVGVVVTLPVLLPVMALTAIAIRVDSPGGALFIQKRVGQGDVDFNIYKFRSMKVDAEAAGAKMATNGDNRITKLGHFIRKTRLDELPQLLNVLKGDMSLIGPRPEQRTFVQQFKDEIPFYTYRHVVKPGITGWAQVTQGYAGDADETRIKIRHDFYYIKHFSLWLDILIVLKTLRVLVTGHGAR